MVDATGGDGVSGLQELIFRGGGRLLIGGLGLTE